jgi:hypothetical protein
MWCTVIVTMVCSMVIGLGAATASATVMPTAAAASCHPYPDVDAGDQHCQNIAWLKAQGITKPADGNYHPAAPVSRGAMAAFLYRFTHDGAAQPTCTSRPFPDVRVDSSFCGYIAWAKSAHVAYGYHDGTYRSGNAVTRGAMVAYLSRIAGIGDAATSCHARIFLDVSAKTQFCSVISWAVTYGVTFGIGSGASFGPALPVTRGAMASFLHRIALLQSSTVTTTYQVTTKDTTIAQLPGKTVDDPTLAIGVTTVDQGHPGTLRTGYRQKYVDGVASGAREQIYQITVTQPTATITRVGTKDACLPSAKACVDLTHNLTWLQSNGTIIYGPVPMLSGRPGYRTPSGNFTVYWKDKDHYSSVYDNAPMPNSVFFVGGVAFHAGSLSVLSHGCIHLSYTSSEVYWDNLTYGDTVSVFGYAPY